MSHKILCACQMRQMSASEIVEFFGVTKKSPVVDALPTVILSESDVDHSQSPTRVTLVITAPRFEVKR